MKSIIVFIILQTLCICSYAESSKPITIIGKIGYGSLDSSISTIDGKGYVFISGDAIGNKILSKCHQDDYCKVIASVINNSDNNTIEIISVVSVNKTNEPVKYNNLKKFNNAHPWKGVFKDPVIGKDIKLVLRDNYDKLKKYLDSSEIHYYNNRTLVYSGWIPHLRTQGDAYLSIDKNGTITAALLEDKKIVIYSSNSTLFMDDSNLINWIEEYKKDLGELKVKWPGWSGDVQ